MMVEEYFWFDKSGPTHLVMRPILEAASKVLPEGTRLYPAALHGSQAFQTLTFKILTMPEQASLCCGDGVAEVKIVLDEGRITATSARYVLGNQ